MATETKKIINRRDTAARWESANPILANGEIGIDTTNKVMKIGDGKTAWNDLKSEHEKIMSEVSSAMSVAIVNAGNYNLIPRDRFTVQGYYNYSGALDTKLSDWVSCSDFIPCKRSTVYYHGAKPLSVVFYTDNKSFISQKLLTQGEGSVTSPSNAAFVRFSSYPNNLNKDTLFFADSQSATKESYPTARTADGLPLSPNTIHGLSEAMNSIGVFGKMSANISRDNNLIIMGDIVEVGYIDSYGRLDSSFGAYGWRSSAHFVPCEASTEYIIERDGQLAVAQYDKNFTFLSQMLDKDKIVTEVGCAYIKISSAAKSARMYKSGTTSDFGRFPSVVLTDAFGMPLRYEGSLKRMKIATLGDSITYRGHYQEIISRYTGASIFNNGLSGRNFAFFAFHRLEGTTSTIDRLLTAEDFDGCDAIILCGYANDLWRNIGKIDDEYITITQEGADSYGLEPYARLIGSKGFIPSVRSVVEYMIKLRPDIPLILSGQLPMSRPKESWEGATNSVDFNRVYDGSNATCADFNAALKQVAEYYSIPYIDMHANGQVNPLNYTQYYDGSDTTHPNYRDVKAGGDYPNSGMKRMAMLFIEGLKKVVYL